MSPSPSQIEWKVRKPSGEHDEPRFPDLPDELPPREFEWNTLTPNDVTPARTDQQVQEMQAQEHALLAGMMSWVTDPVSRYNATVELAGTVEVSRDASATAVADAPGPVGDLSSPIQPFVRAEVPRESSSVQVIPSKAGTEVKRDWSGKLLIVLAVGLGLGAVGTILWASRSALRRSERRYPPNPPIMVVSNSPVKTYDKDSESRAYATKAGTKEQPKPPKRDNTPNSLSKPESARQANDRADELSPRKVSGSVTPVATQKPPSGKAADMANSSPPVLANLVASKVPNVVTDIPVVAPTIANERQKVSSEVARGSLIRQVNPRYPQEAAQARVEGTVVLEAVIGKDGSVQELHPLSGSPLLIPAAMDAVRQWRYKPYQLNGEPVEAETQINVKFALNK